MIKVLFWGDAPAPIIHTGFGVVAQHILAALHNTGLYEIDVLGINYFGSFYDKTQTPYHIVPAKLLDASDPYGNKMLMRSLGEKKYDILFIINDSYVTHGIAKKVEEYKAKYNQDLKVIYYYPVDCIVRKDAAGMIMLADKPVTYTDFARYETLKVLPQLEMKLDVIYHGTDSVSYHPLSVETSRACREKFFGLRPDDNTFIWMSVNRNSVRKNLPQTIYAFAEFKKANPTVKTMLYLHTVPNEQGVDLFVCLNQLGLSHKTDVIFPVKYSPLEAFSSTILNEFYNATDCFLSTSLGEGWGIGQCEAMAAGLPVIAPDNTSTPEILGDVTGEFECQRGYSYRCKEIAYCDNSGYRQSGRVEDVVRAMNYVYNHPPSKKANILQAARKFTMDNSWDAITPKWVDLFDRVYWSKDIPYTELYPEQL